MHDADRAYSIRGVAKTAGVAPSYLSMVIAGERTLSDTFLEQILPVLKLAPAEATYLRLLRSISDAKKPQDRLRALEKIKPFRNKKNKNTKELEVYRYLTEWVYVVIREMAAIPEFKLDAEWIHKRLRPRISVGEVRRAIEFLVENEYLIPLKGNKCKIPDKPIHCRDGVYQVALSRFHQKMLSLQSELVHEIPKDDRHLLGYTVALSHEQYRFVVDRLKEFREKIIQELPKTYSPQDVYHLALTIVPFTETKIGQETGKEEDEES